MIIFELRNMDNILWRIRKDRAEVIADIADNQEASNPGEKGFEPTFRGQGKGTNMDSRTEMLRRLHDCLEVEDKGEGGV